MIMLKEHLKITSDSKTPLQTAMIGFGRIAALYADDAAMKKTVKYASHAQVLVEHSAFLWNAVVDTSADACKLAETRWGVSNTATSVQGLRGRENIRVAVIATPPQARSEVLDALPNLKAVLVEKPLGTTHVDAGEFLRKCEERNVLVQVNLTRRADESTSALAKGDMARRIGKPQAVFGVYGNGLKNNGTHMIDLVRMLFGEIMAVQAGALSEAFVEGPIQGDTNVSFKLWVETGLQVVMQPIHFANYRECSLDIWGERGRLELLQEGLSMSEYPVGPCRSSEGAMEVSSDRVQIMPMTYGEALYKMYDNLAGALHSGMALLSSGSSALKTESVVAAVMESARHDGKKIQLGSRPAS